jgi:malonyl-CoA/methylmalonyl-CoA synthetase
VIGRASRDLLFVHAQRHGGTTAVVDSQGAFTYHDLLNASARVAAALLASQANGEADLHEERVAFLVTPGFPWLVVQWGIWRAGGVAVPLPLNSTKPELEYLVDDTVASTLVFDAHSASLLAPIAAARGIRAMSYEQLRKNVSRRRALVRARSKVKVK